jgi:hypothetical protein
MFSWIIFMKDIQTLCGVVIWDEYKKIKAFVAS